VAVKRFSTKAKSPAQIKKDLAASRVGKGPKAGSNAGRPKGVHTKLPNKKPSLSKTPEQWEEIFVKLFDSIGRTARVIHSCEQSGISYEELLRRRHADPAFELRFQQAYDKGIEALEEEAVRRAFTGVEKPVFYRGQQVATLTECSDALIQFLLKGNKKAKFADRSEVTVNETTKRARLEITDEDLDQLIKQKLGRS